MRRAACARPRRGGTGSASRRQCWPSRCAPGKTERRHPLIWPLSACAATLARGDGRAASRRVERAETCGNELQERCRVAGRARGGRSGVRWLLMGPFQGNGPTCELTTSDMLQ
eukprot:196849-Chlamydomonas_euryale.AAC.4